MQTPTPGTPALTQDGPHLAGVAAGVVGAGGPVLARAGRALVYLVLTVAARVARLAVAMVRVARVHTEPSVSAQVGNIDACGDARGQREARASSRGHVRLRTAPLPTSGDRRPLGTTQWLTLLPGGHLTGDAGHVAVDAGPAAVALAAVQGLGLPALAAVLAGRRVAPAHEVLGVQGQPRSGCLTRPAPGGPAPLAPHPRQRPSARGAWDPTLQKGKLRPKVPAQEQPGGAGGSQAPGPR